MIYRVNIKNNSILIHKYISLKLFIINLKIIKIIYILYIINLYTYNGYKWCVKLIKGLNKGYMHVGVIN